MKNTPQGRDIEHLSYSSMRSYHSNKHEFYKRYILKEKMEKIPVPMAVGSAVHIGIENYLKGKEAYPAKELLSFTLGAGQEIDFESGKITLEEAIEQVEVCLEWFYKYEQDWCGVQSEEGWTVEYEGLKLKGYIDALLPSEGGMGNDMIYDFKTVGSLSYAPNLEYYLQALTYKLIADCVGYNIKGAVFLEIKKKPLKDRKKETLENMIREHEYIDFTEEDVQALLTYYSLTYDEIVNGTQHYLPNFFGKYTDFTLWEEWKERVKTLDIS